MIKTLLLASMCCVQTSNSMTYIQSVDTMSEYGVSLTNQYIHKNVFRVLGVLSISIVIFITISQCLGYYINTLGWPIDTVHYENKAQNTHDKITAKAR